MAKREPPVSLNAEPFIVLQCARNSRRVMLTLPNTESFDLGSYWRCEEIKRVRQDDGTYATRRGAKNYLCSALPGRERFVEELLSWAYTHETAYGDCVQEIVRPINKDTPRHVLEAMCVRRQFAATKADDNEHAESGFYVDTPEVRVAAAETPVKRKKL